MRKITTIVLILFLGCATTKVAIPPAPKSNSVTILHTNDIHGAFLPIVVKAKKAGEKDRKLGGILALDYNVKKIRDQAENVLLLDAGDFMTGNPICDIELNGARGGALVSFFNTIGYEGLTPGNHEFDVSVENAAKLIDSCEFPVFSSNLFRANGKLFTRQPYQIYSKGDLVIGVIGCIVDDLPDYLNKPQRDEVVARPAAPIVDSLAKIIDPLTDLIIVLSHRGLDADKELAQNVGRQIDLIIGGHSHDRLKKAVKTNGKLIVQTGSKLRNLGRLDLTVVADSIQSFNYQLIPLWNEDIQPDSTLAKQVQAYKQQIDEEYGRVIGRLKTRWHRAYNAESNIGNYIADCIRNFSGADFALINSGGIRQNLAAGKIKKLDIKNILPFANSIIKFTVTGKELMEIIRNNASAAATGSHGILQVSGVKYQWKTDENGSAKILKATVNNLPVDPAKTYQGATVDFVITNAQKYLGLIPSQSLNMMMPLTEVVMKMIEDQKVVDSKVEGRMVRID